MTLLRALRDFLYALHLDHCLAYWHAEVERRTQRYRESVEQLRAARAALDDVELAAVRHRTARELRTHDQ